MIALHKSIKQKQSFITITIILAWSTEGLQFGKHLAQLCSGVYTSSQRNATCLLAQELEQVLILLNIRCKTESIFPEYNAIAVVTIVDEFIGIF